MRDKTYIYLPEGIATCDAYFIDTYCRCVSVINLQTYAPWELFKEFNSIIPALELKYT